MRIYIIICSSIDWHEQNSFDHLKNEMVEMLSFIIVFLLFIVPIDSLFFTRSTYELWCEENLLLNSSFVYSQSTPIGIRHNSQIHSVDYRLINELDEDLFIVSSQYLLDFHFLRLNITRPSDINREYRAFYLIKVQATIILSSFYEQIIEQCEVMIFQRCQTRIRISFEFQKDSVYYLFN